MTRRSHASVIGVSPPASSSIMPAAGLGADQRRVKREGRTGILGVAAQRQHVGMAVDDAGRRRQQRRVAFQRRLQRARLVAGQHLHVEHAIGLRMRADRGQLLGLRRRGGDDQLAAIPVRDAVLAAITVERMLAGDAHARHQAPRLVVDAGVDHFAVARRRDGADALGRFQHDHLAPGLREPPRHRKADHASPDHDALDLVHGCFSCPEFAADRGAAALSCWVSC